MDIKDLYTQHLQDHYHNPRNRRKIALPSFSSGQHNPSCGDRILIEGKIKNGVVVDLVFQGQGCVISMAVASMLTEFCKNKKIPDILKLNSQDIAKLVGIKLGPSRMRCAMLPLMAMQDGLEKYENTGSQT